MVKYSVVKNRGAHTNDEKKREEEKKKKKSASQLDFVDAWSSMSAGLMEQVVSSSLTQPFKVYVLPLLAYSVVRVRSTGDRKREKRRGGERERGNDGGREREREDGIGREENDGERGGEEKRGERWRERGEIEDCSTISLSSLSLLSLRSVFPVSPVTPPFFSISRFDIGRLSVVEPTD
jgi:hypothetical protein